jgi:hypothetical protein
MRKKVKNCTINELEQHFIQKFNIKPSHIDIYWYDVRFFTVEEDVIGSKTPKYFLLKDKEIEIN